MTAVFADTFYWIALTDPADNAHAMALELTSEFERTAVVTTDEVLLEYLTFFATAHEWLRRTVNGGASQLSVRGMQMRHQSASQLSKCGRSPLSIRAARDARSLLRNAAQLTVADDRWRVFTAELRRAPRVQESAQQFR